MRCGCVGPESSTLRLSVLNTLVSERPIISFALSMTKPRSGLLMSTAALKPRSLSLSSADLSGPGSMETLTETVVSRRRINSVANRVQRLSLVGKDMPEMASSTELFPAD